MDEPENQCDKVGTEGIWERLPPWREEFVHGTRHASSVGKEKPSSVRSVLRVLRGWWTWMCYL